ncbi:MAG: 50S ribosomal protein L11 methyltransferase [Thermoleophilia bacterium]|nr:50S ribosomal protein L11 methyltransferase [Thermoleophilia bacterium]
MQERPNPSSDVAVRVTVSHEAAEVVAAILMDSLGPCQWEDAASEQSFAQGEVSSEERDQVVLTFYPLDAQEITPAQVLALLPSEALVAGVSRVATVSVPRDWETGWMAHFPPTVVGNVLVRPPWEAAVASSGASECDLAEAPQPVELYERAPTHVRLDRLARRHRDEFVEVVINPGLGFGTGRHPTTRGVLTLLQRPAFEASTDEIVRPSCVGQRSAPTRRPLVDVGTGSGILAIAAAKLGWNPVLAFDNDPQALLSARENVAANGVEGIVKVCEADIETAPIEWFAGATVLANVTLGPVVLLIGRIGSELSHSDKPQRLIVSGILAGEQEEALADAAASSGFACKERLYEGEWVSMELVPTTCTG